MNEKLSSADPSVGRLRELIDQLGERSLEDLLISHREGTFVGDPYDAPNDCETHIIVTRGEMRTLKKAADALAPASEAQGWQPIATAPKDGTPVLIGWSHLPDLCPQPAVWRVDMWIEADTNHEDAAEFIPPTHWMPLPAPPVSEPEDKS